MAAKNNKKGQNKGRRLFVEAISRRPEPVHYDLSKLSMVSKSSIESRVRAIEENMQQHPKLWFKIIREARDDYKLPVEQRISGLEYYIICLANGRLFISDGENRSFKEIAQKPTMIKKSFEAYTEEEIRNIYNSAILRLETRYNDILERDFIREEKDMLNIQD